MILRKPYAILIKFFKLIHIIMFILFIFIAYKLSVIYHFFREFVVSYTFVKIENMASSYINLSLFLVLFVILIGAIAIYYLMREKEKPILFYRLLIIYSLGLIVALIIYYNFFNNLEYNSYNRVTISIYRDIIAVFYYVSYAFLAVSFVRGFGFDIKKFSFEKDIQKLDIKEEDREEFELSIKLDKEKIINYFRRERRLAKYYFKENALTLLIILGISLIVFGFILYRNIEENIVYNQGNIVLADNLNFNVLHTYITNNDKYGDNLNSNYAIVNFDVFNNNSEKLQIAYERFRIEIDNKYYYPVKNKDDSFNDLGTPYKNQYINPSLKETYILIFKIDSYEPKKMVLELYDGINANSGNNAYLYQKINLTKEYFDRKTIGDYKINDTINLSDTIWDKATFKITNYDIANNFIHEYENCVEDKCEKLRKVIISNNSKVLKLNLEHSDIDIALLDNWASIIYNISDKEYTLNAKDAKMLFYDNDTIYFEVSNNIEDANIIKLKFNIRNRLYTVLLYENDKKES